jgi:hypothetical protein
MDSKHIFVQVVVDTRVFFSLVIRALFRTTLQDSTVLVYRHDVVNIFNNFVYSQLLFFYQTFLVDHVF